MQSLEEIVGIGIIIILMVYVICVGAKNNGKEGLVSNGENKNFKQPTLQESRAYCPYKPVYTQQIPWLRNVDNRWYCFENQDGTGASCNYSGSMPAPSDLWGYNKHLESCQKPPGVVDGKTIAYSCATFQCPPGHPQFPDYLSLGCPEKGCDIASCCQPNPKCSTYTCPENFYISSVLKPNADDITCAGSRCTEYECCDTEATDALPATQIWPMTKGLPSATPLTL